MDDTIIQNIQDWASKHLKNFTFREYQLETIHNIVYLIVFGNNKENQIIEAPTGSGKSIICIVSAGVLAEYYKKTSYILCSDLYLWEQYASFIKKNNINFGCLKGLTGNYICSRNNEDIRNSECRMAGISWPKLFKPRDAESIGFNCAKTCKYVKARAKASVSKVVLMTYQLYHYQQNVNKSPYFTERDIIFCDECHNIPDIVQSVCSPCIQKSNFERYISLYEYANTQNSALFGKTSDFLLPKKYSSAKVFSEKLEWYLSEMSKDNDAEYDWCLISEYWEDMQMLREISNEISQFVKDNYAEDLDVYYKKLYKTASYSLNHFCSIEDFTTSIESIEDCPFVKNVNYDKSGNVMIAWSCVKEDYMVWKYILSHAKYRVFTSATVGDKNSFDENNGIRYTTSKTSELYKIPSTFDFSKSPIYCSNKYKMSFSEKEKSLPILEKIFFKICEKHKNEKGIIQTGSYDIAKRIFADAPKEIKKRLTLYNDPKEKEKTIWLHKKKSGSILIGPTLNTGIDLPGDDCRFIVIFKVPYPQLKDKLVKAKMDLFPKWYESKTSTMIIQGVGRGNRFKDDWCVTFILDGCFKRLYESTSEQYPKEMKDRMIFI